MFTYPIFTRSFSSRTVKVVQGLLALVFMSSLIAIQSVKPVSAQSAYAWEAYNDCVGTNSITNTTNILGRTGSGTLKNFDTGTSNQAPVITEGISVSVTMSEDGAPTAFSLTLNATDVDSSTLTWSISTPASNGLASASGIGLSKVIGYTPTANHNGTDSFVVQVSDGSLSDTIMVNVTIQMVNDAPVNSVPGAQTTLEDTALVFNSSRLISVSDLDVSETSDGKLRITISVSHGTLTLSQSTNLTFTSGDGVGDASMTFNGVPSFVNAALNNLSYQPVNNFNGSDTLQIITNDLGNTGLGEIQTDTDTVSINITAINDVPVNSVPGAQTTPEDTALVFNSSRLISVSDLDVSETSNGKLRITISVSHGTLTLSQITNLTFTSGDGVGDASMTFSGVPSFVNAALNNLSYQPAANYDGSDTLQIITSDLGNTGSGGVQTDTDSVSIGITAVNDVPVITEGTSVAVTMSEDGAPTAFSLALNATDVDGSTLTWSISTPASNGSASASGTGLSKAIGYTPTANYNGTDSFVVQVSDGSLSDTITVNVTIQAVNDAPVAHNQTVETIADKTINITLGGSDVEGDPGTWIIISQPSHGALVCESQFCTFTPNPGWIGTDSLRFAIYDQTDFSNVATVTINVLPKPIFITYLPIVIKN